MDHAENGLWIEGVSQQGGDSIKRAFFEFQATYQLGPDDWQRRVFPATGGQIHVWIGKPPQPTFRDQFTINDDEDAGRKVLELLEHLR